MTSWTWKGSPRPWAKDESDAVTEWGGAIKLEDQAAGAPGFPQVGELVRIVPKKGGAGFLHEITEVRAWKNNEGCFVRLSKRVEEDPGSKPLPFSSADDPLPFEEPAPAYGHGVEHPDVPPNDGVADLAARLDKAATVMKMMAGRIEQLEERVAKLAADNEEKTYTLECRLAKLEAPAKPEAALPAGGPGAADDMPFARVEVPA